MRHGDVDEASAADHTDGDGAGPARVLVIGLDPAKLDGWDPEPVLAAIAFNSSPDDCADAALRWLN